MKTAALLLAAGQSSRMGQNKALLEFQGESFVRHIGKCLVDSRLFSEIIAISSRDSDKVAHELNDLNIRILKNDLAETGLMSSVQCGIQALSADCDFVLVFLVDQVPVDKSWIQNLVSAFQAARRNTPHISLARPFVAGQPSHPVMIAKQHFPEILAQEARDQGAAFLFKKYPDQVFHFQIQNAKTTADIDTPEDYQELLNAQ